MADGFLTDGLSCVDGILRIGQPRGSEPLLVALNSIAAVEWQRWISQASDAVVRLHLHGGQTLRVFYPGLPPESDRQASDVARMVGSLMAAYQRGLEG